MPRMTRKRASQASSKGRRIGAAESSEADQPEVPDGTPKADTSDQVALGDATPGSTGLAVLRTWWKRFRAEFIRAHPEKQVAQIYYIMAILAVAGSLVAGLR